MVNRFVSAEEFLLEGGFLSSIEFFQVTSSFHLCHLYECNALSVKNVERHITVWWSKAWDDVFALSCHKWSILDVQFRVKMIESCSSGASPQGVDIFLGAGGIPYLFGFLFHSSEDQSFWYPASSACVCQTRFPFKWGHKPIDSEFQCYCDVTKQATRSTTSPHSAVLWRNWRRKPTFFGKELFSLFCAPTYCSGFYLSCLYMWKTEQQTAVSISFRPSAELDFPLFPQQLSEIAHCSLKKGGRGESNLLSFHAQTCPRQVTNKWTLGVFFPPRRQQLHTLAVLWHENVTASQSNNLCHKPFLPSRRKAVWTPMLCRLRSVCAVVPGVCLLLHKGLDEWLYWLHENNCGYYWYSQWAKKV